MKKKIAVLGTALLIAAAVTACGGKDTKTETTVPVETAAPATTAAPAETAVPADTQATEADMDTESGSEAQEPSGEGAALSQEEINTFAKSVKAAVADKDLEALAGLCSYPVYVSMGESGGEDIGSRDDFMKLKADQVFTPDLVKEIADTEADSLEQFGAGVIMGKENSITFNNMGGKAAITSIILQ